MEDISTILISILVLLVIVSLVHLVKEAKVDYGLGNKDFISPTGAVRLSTATVFREGAGRDMILKRLIEKEKDIARI